jgi:carbamoyl-phosphate synthase large subunit
MTKATSNDPLDLDASRDPQARTRVLVRQPLTEAGPEERRVVQAAMDEIRSFEKPANLEFLAPLVAREDADFRADFEARVGVPFTPAAFRAYRLGLVAKTDLFVNIRAGLSESSAFEIAYNIFSGRRAPLFFAVWQGAPIKTTLLRDLEDMCPCVYVEFREPSELRRALQGYFGAFARARTASAESQA